MQHWKIVTKIVVYTCAAMAVLLGLSGIGLFWLEREREAGFVAEYQAELENANNEREQAERASLRKNVAFNAELLRQIGALPLYNIDPYGMQTILRSYIAYPEILAIQVVNEIGEPFAAIWKSPDIMEGETLPENLDLAGNVSLRVDVEYEGKKVGELQVFYTDAPLKEAAQAARVSDAERIAAFRQKSRARRMNNLLQQIGGGTIILLALTLCQLLFLRVLIFKRLVTVSGLARRLTQLDLTVTAETSKRDEIGAMFLALDEMIGSFKQVIGQVQHSGVQVTSSSTELAAAAKEQEVTIELQMDTIRRMVLSARNIAELADELMNSIQQVAAMSQETARFASSGQTDLTRMSDAMQHMEIASSSISDRLEAINEKAENITTVVTTINKVAEQTNLLSLNAAIEAEKAGEYGRGFTVVAREIRRLADQTAVATLDIDQMVRAMQSAVSTGVMEMDKFIADVRNSTNDVERISLQLANIITQVQALSPGFEDVQDAMHVQSENACQLSANMTHLGEEVQQTTTSLRESFAAIEQLNEAARGLHAQVSRFKIG